MKIALPKWIDGKKGSDPLVDDLIAYIEQLAAPQVVADERAAFEKAMNDLRFFPAKLDFSRAPSPGGRDEYANKHLESCWNGWQARAALAAAPVQAQEPVLEMLLEVTRLAYDAMDNAEENEHGLQWHKPDFDELSAAMDKLESLPDDQPGYVMGPAAKAAWALHNRAPVQPVAVPDGWRDAALELAVQAVAERAGESETIAAISAFDAIRSLKKNRHALPESSIASAAQGDIDDEKAELVRAGLALMVNLKTVKDELETLKGDAKDAEYLRWMVESGARISWSMDGEYCNVWLPAERDGKESRPAEGYPQKCYDSWHRAIEAAIAASRVGE
ncbi:hypothetical protein JAB1_46740 [Janthinobacterium sp. MP5059B]|nr:hypothetical protein JAB1_46740 [Janthinobacterium sp. MP5059B]